MKKIITFSIMFSLLGVSTQTFAMDTTNKEEMSNLELLAKTTRLLAKYMLQAPYSLTNKLGYNKFKEAYKNWRKN